jgi:predicted signal transduction protein with EAL and GGDEF domain
VLSAVDGSEAVAKVAENLLAAMATPFEIEGVSVTVGATVGGSLYPAHADTGPELLRLADMAMYAAKSREGLPFAFHDSKE